MTRGKAFLVVGHSNWGKSFTLRALSGGTTKKWIRIRGQRVFIRYMSNDDVPGSFHRSVRGLDPAKKHYICIAFCPRVSDAPTAKTIRALRSRYDIVSFVMAQAYNGEKRLKPHEIGALKWLGDTRVLWERRSAPARARALRALIERHLKRDGIG